MSPESQPVTLADLQRWFSTERMSTYVRSAQTTDCDVIDLYAWNGRNSKGFGTLGIRCSAYRVQIGYIAKVSAVYLSGVTSCCSIHALISCSRYRMSRPIFAYGSSRCSFLQRARVLTGILDLCCLRWCEERIVCDESGVLSSYGYSYW